MYLKDWQLKFSFFFWLLEELSSLDWNHFLPILYALDLS